MHQSAKSVVLGCRVDRGTEVDEDALDHEEGQVSRVPDRNAPNYPSGGVEEASVEHKEGNPPKFVVSIVAPELEGVNGSNLDATHWFW